MFSHFNVLKRFPLLIVVTSTCARPAQSQDDSGSTIETASAETVHTEISPKRILHAPIPLASVLRQPERAAAQSMGSDVSLPSLVGKFS